MTPRIFSLSATAVFSLIALGHAIRLLFDWHVTVENIVVPVWISWIGPRHCDVFGLPRFPVSEDNDEVVVMTLAKALKLDFSARKRSVWQHHVAELRLAR